MEAPQLEIFEDIEAPVVQTINLRQGINLNLGNIVAVNGKSYCIVSGSFGTSGERYMALPISADESKGTIDTLIQKGLRRKITAVINIDTIAQYSLFPPSHNSV